MNRFLALGSYLHFKHSYGNLINKASGGQASCNKFKAECSSTSYHLTVCNVCETDIVKQSDIKSLLLKQCDQDINEKNSTPPPFQKKKKKDPHTNLCKLAYKNSPYSELYAVLLKL